MSVGKAILRVRQDQGMTQRKVAERAGLAVSYVSRIENDHVQPTMKTLIALAEALETPVSRIFAIGEHSLALRDKCPVSHSGHCIGELIRSRPELRPDGERAAYGAEELRLLRMTDFIVLRGPADVRKALAVVLESLMARTMSGTPS